MLLFHFLEVRSDLGLFLRNDIAFVGFVHGGLDTDEATAAIDLEASLTQGGKRQTSSRHLVFRLEFVAVGANLVGFVGSHVIKSFLPAGALHAGRKADKCVVQGLRIVRGTGAADKRKSEEC